MTQTQKEKEQVDKVLVLQLNYLSSLGRKPTQQEMDISGQVYEMVYELQKENRELRDKLADILLRPVENLTDE